jgi:hypothetical protein
MPSRPETKPQAGLRRANPIDPEQPGTTHYGSDPITPDRLPYGAISAIPLAAKAILITKIWKERAGERQDIHVDVRKALRPGEYRYP